MEEAEPSLILAGIGICLLVLALASAIEIALAAIAPQRLNALLDESQGDQRITRPALAWIINNPYYFKSSLILLNTLTLITATALTAGLSFRYGATAVVGALGGLLAATLIVAGVIPRALAVRDPAAVVRLLAGPMAAAAMALWPLVGLISLVSRPLFRLLSGQEAPPSLPATTGELWPSAGAGREQAAIEQEERKMIEGIIAFGDTLVREIMVPRVDIVALERDSTIEQALDVVSSSGHSRIPVYEGTLDNIVGILYAKDLISALRHDDKRRPISTMLRPAHFVPETMKVNALLEDLQRRKVHMAIIVDEYGGTAGLATIEDLIEQIVGEIQDEYDTEDPSVQPIGEDVFIVDARLPIEDVNDLLDLHLASETAERIGGLVYEHLGRVPRPGDQVDLGEALVTVQSIKGVRAHKLQIERRRPASTLSMNGVASVGKANGPT